MARQSGNVSLTLEEDTKPPSDTAVLFPETQIDGPISGQRVNLCLSVSPAEGLSNLVVSPEPSSEVDYMLTMNFEGIS